MKIDTSALRDLAARIRSTAIPIGLVADELDQAIVGIEAQSDLEPASEAAPAAAPSPARKARKRVTAKTKRASRKR